MTFDDGIRGQFDVAFPIMQELNLQGFFFIYSSILKDTVNIIELVRFFRENFYSNINFYSIDDIKFRLVRDNFTSIKNFNKINLILFKKYNFDYKKKQKNLYFSKDNIKELSKHSNEIGLHTHTHPTNISKLSMKKQLLEYETNKKILEKVINKKIFSMSHPCGRYNLNTIKVLNFLKIKIGFLSSKNYKFDYKKRNNNFLIPREDHINLLNNV